MEQLHVRNMVGASLNTKAPGHEFFTKEIKEVNEALVHAVKNQNPDMVMHLLQSSFADVNMKYEPEDKVLIQIAFDEYKKAFQLSDYREKVARRIMRQIFNHSSFVFVPDEELQPEQAVGEVIAGPRMHDRRWLVCLHAKVAVSSNSIALLEKLPRLSTGELNELVTAALAWSKSEELLEWVFNIPGAHTVMQDTRRVPIQPNYKNVCWLLRQRFTKNWGLAELSELSNWENDKNRHFLYRILCDERLLVGKLANKPLEDYFSDDATTRARVRQLYEWVCDSRKKFEYNLYFDDSPAAEMRLYNNSDMLMVWTSDLRAAIQYNNVKVFAFLLQHYEYEIPIELYCRACIRGRDIILAMMIEKDNFAAVDRLATDAVDGYPVTKKLLLCCSIVWRNRALLELLRHKAFRQNASACYADFLLPPVAKYELGLFDASDDLPDVEWTNQRIRTGDFDFESLFEYLAELYDEGKLEEKQLVPAPAAAAISSSSNKRRREGETEEDALQIDGSVRLLISQL